MFLFINLQRLAVGDYAIILIIFAALNEIEVDFLVYIELWVVECTIHGWLEMNEME